MIVFFYGGSWDSGEGTDYAWVGQALARRATSSSARLPALSRGALSRVSGGWRRAARWARDHAADYGGDPNRIVLVGHRRGPTTPR